MLQSIEDSPQVTQKISSQGYIAAEKKHNLSENKMNLP